MADEFFKKMDESKVVEAIRLAESHSRGEIRVHVTSDAVPDVMRAATVAFEKLGMTETRERNGVLIFVAASSRKFSVLGDKGITSLVGTRAWDEIAALLATAFREEQFTAGLVTAVERAGALLAAHFPPVEGKNDANELSNQISPD